MNLSSLSDLCSLRVYNHTGVDTVRPQRWFFSFSSMMLIDAWGFYSCKSLGHTTLYFKSPDINYVLWLDNGSRFPRRRTEKFNQMNFSVLRCGRAVWGLTEDAGKTLRLQRLLFEAQRKTQRKKWSQPKTQRKKRRSIYRALELLQCISDETIHAEVQWPYM